MHPSNSTVYDVLLFYMSIICMKSFGIEFLHFRKLKTGTFIHDAIESRLRMIIPYIDKWPQVSDNKLVISLPESSQSLGHLSPWVISFLGSVWAG